MANSSVTHAYTKLTQHVHAVCEACHCLLVVGDIGQRFCTGLNALGATVNREIINKNTKMQRTWHYADCKKAAFTVWKLKPVCCLR